MMPGYPPSANQANGHGSPGVRSHQVFCSTGFRFRFERTVTNISRKKASPPRASVSRDANFASLFASNSTAADTTSIFRTVGRSQILPNELIFEINRRTPEVLLVKLCEVAASPMILIADQGITGPLNRRSKIPATDITRTGRRSLLTL